MENNTSEIKQLEEILRQNPDSPVFIRLAALYIKSGEYLHALALCDRGTGTYPEYATGFLLRAEALQHLEKFEESIENYQKVLDILPRCAVAGNRIEELKRKLKKTKPELPTDKEKEPKTEGKEIPHKKPKADLIENLAEQLKGYKPARPDSERMKNESVDMGDTSEGDLPIVSETLATIFFKQKQFDRAIEAYRQLIKRNPEKADIYLTKIKEVEEAKNNEG